MSTSEHWDDVQPILELFFPQFFDPESPQYVDPAIMEKLALIADDARPWCIPEAQQDIAQAYFIAYLVTLRNETSTGVSKPQVAGPIVSEREGDIAVVYANLSSQKSDTATQSKRPPSDPWDVWNRYWMRCAAGAIMTRFGDPCRDGTQFTINIIPLAMRVWYPIW